MTRTRPPLSSKSDLPGAPAGVMLPRKHCPPGGRRPRTGVRPVASGAHGRARQGDTPRRRNDEQGVSEMDETTELQRLLTVHEVAEVPGTADGFVRQLVAARRIRFRWVGKHLRFPASAVPEYPAAVTVEPLPSRGRECVMGKRVRGSIRRLPSGRWQVRYTGLDGLRRTLEQTHRTAECRGGVRDRRGGHGDGSVGGPVAGRGDLRDVRRSVGRGASDDHRSDPRACTDAAAAASGAVPGRRPGLRHFSPALVRRWRQGRQDAGVGASTIAKAYWLLRSIMATAVDDEVILRNPCRIRGAGTRWPRSGRSSPRPRSRAWPR